MANGIERKLKPSIQYGDAYTPSFRRERKTVFGGIGIQHNNTVDNFMRIRYYKRTVCILCGDTILHNQYNNNKLFSRIAHIECVKRNGKGKKRSRMNSHILIRDTQRIINGKRITTWRKV